MPATVNNLTQVNLDIISNESAELKSTELKATLRDLKAFIDDMLEAISGNQDIPVIIDKSIKHYEATFLDHYNKLLIWVSREKDNNETAAGKTPALWVS